MDQLNDNQIASGLRKTPMLELLNEYEKTQGMTIKDFCKLRQINEGAFYAARKRVRTIAKKQSSGFAALSTSSPKVSAGTLFAEVNGIKLYHAVPADYLKALLA